MKKTVSLTRKEFVKEHKKLLKTLRRPTKKKLRNEVKEQSEEMKELKKPDVSNKKPAYIG